MSAPDRVDNLLAEAEAQPFQGWDFSWLADRTTTEPVAWDFREIVADGAAESPDLLDMGTGGGEWLASLPVHPPRTVAVEGWPPNVPVARERLASLGIDVVEASGGPDNREQADTGTRPPPAGSDGALPFPDQSFHLISNRHESFVPSEIQRLLVPGGRLLTQQVGGDMARDERQALGLPVPETNGRPWDLVAAAHQLERSGLIITRSGSGEERTTYHDVGGFAWYLKAIPWMIPGFTIAAYRDQLAALQRRIDQGQPLVMRLPLFWLEARRRD